LGFCKTLRAARDLLKKFDHAGRFREF